MRDIERKPYPDLKSILQFAVAAAICVLGYVFLLSVMRGAPYDTGLAIPTLVLAVAPFALNVVFFRREPVTRCGEWRVASLAPAAAAAPFAATFLASAAFCYLAA